MRNLALGALLALAALPAAAEIKTARFPVSLKIQCDDLELKNSITSSLSHSLRKLDEVKVFKSGLYQVEVVVISVPVGAQHGFAMAYHFVKPTNGQLAIAIGKRLKYRPGDPLLKAAILVHDTEYLACEFAGVEFIDQACDRIAKALDAQILEPIRSADVSEKSTGE